MAQVQETQVRDPEIQPIAPALPTVGPASTLTEGEEEKGKKRKEPSSSDATDCKFFLQGTCKFGERCRNAHDRKKLKGGEENKIKLLGPSVPGVESTLTAPTTDVCKWLTKGTCKFGARCRNYHPPGSLVSPRPISIFQYSPFTLGTSALGTSALATALGTSALGLGTSSLSPTALAKEDKVGEKSDGKDPKESVLCKWYLRGDCKFGVRCRSLHPDPTALGLSMASQFSPEVAASQYQMPFGFNPAFGAGYGDMGLAGLSGLSQPVLLDTSGLPTSDQLALDRTNPSTQAYESGVEGAYGVYGSAPSTSAMPSHNFSLDSQKQYSSFAQPSNPTTGAPFYGQYT